MYICVYVYVLMIKDSNWKSKAEQIVLVREWKREKKDAINKPRNKIKPRKLNEYMERRHRTYCLTQNVYTTLRIARETQHDIMIYYNT